MQIQQYSADEKGIRLSIDYKNFAENEKYIMCSDKKRIQQILLNL